MASRDEIDLMAPFRDLKIAAAQSRFRASNAAVEVKVRDRITLDLAEARDVGLTLAQELKKEAIAELERGDVGLVDESTLARRQRVIRRKDGRFRNRTFRDQERYPAGYRPNPARTTYGIDSGYLRDNVQAREEGKRTGEFSLAIPSNRAKAAYIRRSRVLDAKSNTYRTIFKRVVNGVVTEMIKVNGKARRVSRKRR